MLFQDGRALFLIGLGIVFLMDWALFLDGYGVCPGKSRHLRDEGIPVAEALQRWASYRTCFGQCQRLPQLWTDLADSF